MDNAAARVSRGTNAKERVSKDQRLAPVPPSPLYVAITKQKLARNAMMETRRITMGVLQAAKQKNAAMMLSKRMNNVTMDLKMELASLALLSANSMCVAIVWYAAIGVVVIYR
jgi:hypothetical protein